MVKPRLVRGAQPVEGTGAPREAGWWAFDTPDQLHGGVRTDMSTAGASGVRGC